jgi:DNA-directed RNA polymerase subunit beta
MVGDKLSNRHGAKGVVGKVLPVADMPYLPDGTPVEMLLNPIGVPTRLNLGQIWETHLGLIARALGVRFVIPPFHTLSREELRALFAEAGLPATGMIRLIDGCTGRPFDQPATVGWLYTHKLNHLVEDKIHARSTGPYSLLTQQPVGGKAQFGGQRLGEMEVWALEAYGAAHVLQEMLTTKADDVAGRRALYEALLHGAEPPAAGLPETCRILFKELQGLGLEVTSDE